MYMSFIWWNSVKNQISWSRNGRGDVQRAQGQSPRSSSCFLCDYVQLSRGTARWWILLSLHFLMIQESICSASPACRGCRWCSWDRRWQSCPPAAAEWFSRPGFSRLVSCSALPLPPRCWSRLKAPSRAAWVAEGTLWCPRHSGRVTAACRVPERGWWQRRSIPQHPGQLTAGLGRPGRQAVPKSRWKVHFFPPQPCILIDY